MSEGDNTFTLPSGATVVFKDPDSVSRKARKPVQRGFAALKGVEDEDRQEAALDRLLALMIRGWSFDYPIPSEDISSLDEIPGVDYDALGLEVIKDNRAPWLSTGINPDPKASTDNSKSSNGALPTEISKTVTTSPTT